LPGKSRAAGFTSDAVCMAHPVFSRSAKAAALGRGGPVACRPRGATSSNRSIAGFLLVALRPPDLQAIALIQGCDCRRSMGIGCFDAFSCFGRVEPGGLQQGRALPKMRGDSVVAENSALAHHGRWGGMPSFIDGLWFVRRSDPGIRLSGMDVFGRLVTGMRFVRIT